MGQHFDATAIYEAGRRKVSDAIGTPGPRARYERGQLSVSQFKRIATPERLTDLLEWADGFITAVNETDSSFARRVRQIKGEMQIESF